MSINDNVNHPSHYVSKPGDPYEAIKVIEAWQLDFTLGNAVKYICRAGKKSSATEVEDLLKSMWYVARRIKQLGGDARLAETCEKLAAEAKKP